MSGSGSVRQDFKQVLELTKRKVESDDLYREYLVLEQVPPVPGQPHKQHSAMVMQGLCQQVRGYWNNFFLQIWENLDLNFKLKISKLSWNSVALVNDVTSALVIKELSLCNLFKAIEIS